MFEHIPLQLGLDSKCFIKEIFSFLNVVGEIKPSDAESCGYLNIVGMVCNQLHKYPHFSETIQIMH